PIPCLETRAWSWRRIQASRCFHLRPGIRSHSQLSIVGCTFPAHWISVLRSVRPHLIMADDVLHLGDQLPSGISAADWIAHHARSSPRAEAALDLSSGRRYTYAQFDARIARTALWLAAACGISRGDRVAVLSRNDTDVFEIQFACQRLGAIFVPLNWR